MKVYIELSREEIHNQIPYALVCETFETGITKTGKGKRIFNDMFAESEKRPARELTRTAKRWTLGTGVPDFVRIRPTTLSLWHKLGDYCMRL